MLEGQFTLPIQIELVATLLFALTGALQALNRGYDVIGLFALAFVTGVGGGLIRDGLFIQQGPPVVTSDSRYILMVMLAGFVTLLFRGRVIGMNRVAAWVDALGVRAPHLRERIIWFNKVIAWLDALGLGAYAVVGVQKSLNAGLSVAAAVLVGVINAAGGGLLRDVLVRDEPLLFKPGQFYVLAAFVGCLLFPLLALYFRMDATLAALIAIGTTFVLRALAIQFNWVSPSLLRQQGPDPATDPVRNSTPPGS
ncbi:MAG: TRIC cation channel family protein [Verrucomicrobiae bacterium]|nr:TRIC cation channel family protein [Verrucomicrobiae bacterium]